MPCALGRAGIVANKREGDHATPRGVFRLETLWVRPDRVEPPDTVLATRPIGPADGWSDDPSDPRYNCWVRRPHRFRCEALRRADPLYDLVVVFDANRHPIIPGNGSALFMHVWRKPRHPTEGCVAFARKDLIWLLERWTDRSRLVVR